MTTDREQGRSVRVPARLRLGVVLLTAAAAASSSLAAERELEESPPPSSTTGIETPIQRMVQPEAPRQQPLFPLFRNRIEDLPAFFSDTEFVLHYRTYYLWKDRTSDVESEAWAMGGSISYRSGWLAEMFQVELEGFTSQPIVAPGDKGGTGLLQPVQDGYAVLGIANARFRYRGFQLTGYRQYLDLPYVNRNDSRMTPNTFEAVTLEKSHGDLRFIAGYGWGVKQRNSDDFVPVGEILGLDRDLGLAYGGVIWDPSEDGHLGAYFGGVPDVAFRTYGEAGVGHAFGSGWHGRIDGQFMYVWDIGEDLLGDAAEDTWNCALRVAASRWGAVLRLGVGFAGQQQSNEGNFGSVPSYLDLMQRTFNAPHEKALLVSASYDFSELDVDGLSAIVNFAAGFDAEIDGRRRKSQELDLTLDYRVNEGWLKSFWFRVRGSWLRQEATKRDGADLRVILRYDFPVI